jgi:phosphonate transport system permease protein
VSRLEGQRRGRLRGRDARPRSARGRSERLRVLLGVVLAGVLSAVYLGLDPIAFFSKVRSWKVVGEFVRAAFLPTLTSESGSGYFLLPQIWEGIYTTVMFAAAGMGLAMILGGVLGFFASRAWWDGELVEGGGGWSDRMARRVGPVVTFATRMLIAFLRSIHELLWAILFLSAFGLSDSTAVLAIALPYGGILAKIFSEMLDETPPDAAIALRGAGGGAGTVLFIGLLPRALPDIATYSFYRFECAIRSSAVLGFFGFPTLGYYISASFENLYYREVWTYLYALIGLVVLVETWSGWLRRRQAFA